MDSPLTTASARLWLAYDAARAVVWARVALATGSVASAQRALAGRPRRRRAAVDAATAARYVRRAGSLLPRTRCLPRALALQSLLAQRGIESELALGMRRMPSGELAGHAWLETAAGRLLDEPGYLPMGHP